MPKETYTKLGILLITIFTVTVSFITAPALADEAADKAEFQKLYAQFNDLYANSEDLDPIIEVAENLYELAPKIYGKNSQNTAVVTYNLASLYDEKGGDERNSDEGKAFNLYQEYFQILDTLNTPKDKTYLAQYLAMVNAEFNSTTFQSNKKYSEYLLELAEKIDISDVEKANIIYTVAFHRYNNADSKEAKNLYLEARHIYEKAYGSDHQKVGEMLFYIARIDFGKKNYREAEQGFLNAITILDKINEENASAMVLVSHRNLIKIYSEKGEVDKATPHCIAFARKTPKEFTRKSKPLYEILAKFPNFMKRKEVGAATTVTVEFDVDENGFTTNISVHNAQNDAVRKIAEDTIRKFRFAPRIVNGKPQGIKGFQHTFTFSRI